MPNRRKLADPKSIVITIGGLHGTGKTTYARALAQDLGLRHISAGQLFRDIAKEKNLSLEELNDLACSDPKIDQLIDQRTREEAEKGGTIIDGQLASAIAGEKADLRILITAPERVRMERISRRDAIPFEEVVKKTTERERSERERYRRYYRLDVSDSSIYDIVVDTGMRTIEETMKILKSAIEDYIEKQSQR